CSGMKFLRILGINKESNLELFVLSAASGFALISEGLLFLGMIGFSTPMTLCLLLIGLFVISAREAKFFLKAFISYLYHRDFSFTSHHFLTGTFCIFVIINILKALLPPHGPTDVLFYHMTIPKLYLTHGSIVTNPTFFPSFFPSNGELLFSLALVIGGPVMVNLTHFGFALLTVMALYVYTQKYFAKEFALIPGIIYLTAPVINSWGTMAYTCNILGFYLLILSILLMECNKETKVNEVAFLGLITGMALGIKYQAIPLVGCIYSFFFVYKMTNLKRRGLVFTGALLLAIILASPWFVRNFLITENPFFPILNDIFPSEMMRSESTWEKGTSAGGAFVLGLNKLKENYFFPFSYLWTGAWGHDEDFQRFIGPLFLFFTPFIFFLRKNPLKWPLIILICFLSYLATLCLAGNIRYVVILVILLALLCGAVGQRIMSFGKVVRYICLGFFISFVIFYSFQNYNLMLSHKRILTAFNQKLTPDFLRTYEISYVPAEWANRNLPNDAKVLFHGFVRYFYFKFEPYNDHLSQTFINYDKAKNGEDILRILRSQSFTHIISSDKIHENYRKDTILYDEDPRFIDFTQKYLVKIFSANGISIYKIHFM
ncbi:MAG TPA: glycosyltransferase family 39 protein, partial [Thermodesulfobacteriota bacterium]|nr:glycosyltransferase family 39 protein [Thermodesulfobacteriota bacterium]